MKVFNEPRVRRGNCVPGPWEPWGWPLGRRESSRSCVLRIRRKNHPGLCLLLPSYWLSLARASQPGSPVGGRRGQGLWVEEDGSGPWRPVSTGVVWGAGTGGCSEPLSSSAKTCLASQVTCPFPSSSTALHACPIWVGLGPVVLRCGRWAMGHRQAHALAFLVLGQLWFISTCGL